MDAYEDQENYLRDQEKKAQADNTGKAPSNPEPKNVEKDTRAFSDDHKINKDKDHMSEAKRYEGHQEDLAPHHDDIQTKKEVHQKSSNDAFKDEEE